MQKIILASASPRRIEIMKKHGFKPEIVPAHIDEVLPFSMSSEASVMYLALKKALNVSLRVSYSSSIFSSLPIPLSFSKIKSLENRKHRKKPLQF